MTRIADITFEDEQLIDPTGEVAITSAEPIKDSYSMQAGDSVGYITVTIDDFPTIYISTYVKVLEINTAAITLLAINDTYLAVLTPTGFKLTSTIAGDYGSIYPYVLGDTYRIGLHYNAEGGGSLQLFIAEEEFDEPWTAVEPRDSTLVSTVTIGVNDGAGIVIFDNIRIDDTTMPGPDIVEVSTTIYRNIATIAFTGTDQSTASFTESNIGTVRIE